MRINYACFSENLTPSPMFHPNGTFYIIFHCDDDDSHQCCDLAMHRGDSWEGPLEPVNNKVFSISQAPGHPEDPFLWFDKRGNWHMLLHNGPHGLHLYSRNGLKFTVAKGNKGPWPFTTDISTTKGVVQTNRRERPVLVFEHGRPRFLVTSVAPKNGRVYTHVQEINISPSPSPPSPPTSDGITLFEKGGSGKLVLSRNDFVENPNRQGKLAWDSCGGAKFDNGHPVHNTGNEIGAVKLNGNWELKFANECALTYVYGSVSFSRSATSQDGKISLGDGTDYFEVATSQQFV